MIKEAIISEVVKVVMAHKDEYLEQIKAAVIKRLEVIDADADGKPDVEEIKQEVSVVIDQLHAIYGHVKAVVDKYGVKKV